MNQTDDYQALLRKPPVQMYLFLAIGCLAVILLLQVYNGNALYGMLVFMIGVLGIISRFRAAPIWVLLVLAGGEVLYKQFVPWEFSTYEMFVQGMAVLGYVLGHYRFLGLTLNLFPVDPRLREVPKPGKKSRVPFLRRRPQLFTRPVNSVSPIELSLALMALPFWGIVAQYGWYFLEKAGNFRLFSEIVPSFRAIDLDYVLSQIAAVAFVLFLGITLVGILLWYWRLTKLSPDQAQLVMRDVLWQETRREQRRNARWRVASRISRNQREKKL